MRVWADICFSPFEDKGEPSFHLVTIAYLKFQLIEHKRRNLWRIFYRFQGEEPFRCVSFGGSGTLLWMCYSFPIFFFFILAIDGHKNRSGKRCSGRFVEEGSTKASHRCLSFFSSVKEIVQASLCHDKTAEICWDLSLRRTH